MHFSAQNADDVLPVVRKRQRRKRRKTSLGFFNDTLCSSTFGVFLLVFVLLLSRCVLEIECVDENDDDGVTRVNSDDEEFRRKKNANDRYEEEAEYMEEERKKKREEVGVRRKRIMRRRTRMNLPN